MRNMPIWNGQNGFKVEMSQRSLLSSKRWRHFIILGVVVTLLASCSPNADTITVTQTSPQQTILDKTATPTPTERPTPTPTTAPLGTDANPITMGFILNPEDNTAMEAAEDVAFLISGDSGYSIRSVFYPDFQSYATDAINEKVHLLWLLPLEYLFLHQQGAADALVMTNHLGVYAYGVQFLANANRGFRTYYDPDLNQSTGSALEALQQFAGTKPCYINDHSTPGYFVPSGLLTVTSTPTLDPVFTQGYSAIIRALYIEGICDFGVTYALTGDPRSASDVIQDLNDVRDRVVVVWQSEGIIPNLSISTTSNVPENVRFNIQEAIINIPSHSEGLVLLSTALNYDIQALKEVSDSFYNSFREVIFPLELDLKAVTQD